MRHLRPAALVVYACLPFSLHNALADDVPKPSAASLRSWLCVLLESADPRAAVQAFPGLPKDTVIPETTVSKNSKTLFLMKSNLFVTIGWGDDQHMLSVGVTWNYPNQVDPPPHRLFDSDADAGVLLAAVRRLGKCEGALTNKDGLTCTHFEAIDGGIENVSVFLKQESITIISMGDKPWSSGSTRRTLCGTPP